MRPFERYLCHVCIRRIERLERPDPEGVSRRVKRYTNIKSDEDLFVGYDFIVDDLSQRIIHHFKYHSMPRLARRSGVLLARQYDELSSKCDLILPVPLHRTRLATRGYNQSEELAKGIADVWKVPYLKQRHLKRLRPTQSQTLLTAEERKRNVENAFGLSTRAIREIGSKRVLIVDDVLTTGATIASFASAVRVAEPKRISYLTFAAATSSSG